MEEILFIDLAKLDPQHMASILENVRSMSLRTFSINGIDRHELSSDPPYPEGEAVVYPEKELLVLTVPTKEVESLLRDLGIEAADLTAGFEL